MKAGKKGIRWGCSKGIPTYETIGIPLEALPKNTLKYFKFTYNEELISFPWYIVGRICRRNNIQSSRDCTITIELFHMREITTITMWNYNKHFYLISFTSIPSISQHFSQLCYMMSVLALIGTKNVQNFS